MAQDYFIINRYDVSIKVNKDASLDVEETINARFLLPRHGIVRVIPFKYQLQALPAGTEKANRQLDWGGKAYTIIENIQVDGRNFTVNTEGDYKYLKIGDEDKLVDSNQQYVIRYRILNAINFFKDHAELYFNVIGDKWTAVIDTAYFKVELYDALPSQPDYFVATGTSGSKDNNTVTQWVDNKTFTGHTTKMLSVYEGLTLGIVLPKGFLTEQDYRMKNIEWLFLPAGILVIMFLVWRRWGKDEKPIIQTEYYPPEHLSPSVCGYLIDDKLHRRDLTALIPYWGAGGYLEVHEAQSSSLFGIIKNKEYSFIRLKQLPDAAPVFEKTLFNGIFQYGDSVELSSLKNKLYRTMDKAKRQLELEIKINQYYFKNSSRLGCLLSVLSIAMIAYGIFALITSNGIWWQGIAFIASGIITIIFGALMTKKTIKGTELYQKLLGFKEFIRSVEKDRLQEFLKQDEHYFDTILPYAIVFNIADTWKDKLEGLEVPPPNWYTGNYTSFTTANFMRSLNHSMNEMSGSFYSTPGSGGSFSSGGSSGGGFGGGGGSSW